MTKTRSSHGVYTESNVPGVFFSSFKNAMMTRWNQPLKSCCLFAVYQTLCCNRCSTWMRMFLILMLHIKLSFLFFAFFPLRVDLLALMMVSTRLCYNWYFGIKLQQSVHCLHKVHFSHSFSGSSMLYITEYICSYFIIVLLLLFHPFILFPLLIKLAIEKKKKVSQEYLTLKFQPRS